MQRVRFELNGEYVEINQLLKLGGGAGKALVADGGVKLDGVKETRKTAKVHAGQYVTIGDIRIDVVAQGSGS